MAAPGMSASYVRPAPTLACALQNTLRGSKKSLCGVSVVEVGIVARDAPSKTQENRMSRKGYSMEQQCRGWSMRSSRGMQVHASAAAVETAESPKLRTGTWNWSHEGASLSINFVEFGSQGDAQEMLLLLPTLSDVSTTEEWHAVAEELVANGKRRAVVVDWPGLGLSDRPALEYAVDVLEKFLVEFVAAANGPLAGVQGLWPSFSVVS